MSSDLVTRWEFPADVYPRYNYFRDRLLRLVPRFQRVIDAGDLSEALFRGKEWIIEIQNNAKYLEEKLTVTILHDASVDANTVSTFTPKCFLGNDDVKPTGSAKLSRSSKQIEWSSLKELGEKLNIHHPHIYVVLINSKQEYIPSRIDAIVEGLSIVQYSNAVIYDVCTEKSRPLSDCKRTPEHNDIDLGWVNDEQPGLSVMKNIQDLLEFKVVDVIEDIATFIRSFEQTGSSLPERSLIDEVNHTLRSYLNKPYVQKELCEVIGLKSVLNIPMETEESQTEESDTSQRTGKEADCLFKYTEDEFIKICKFIAKCTKNTVCEHLSLRYGLKPAIINAFICCSDYNLEDEFTTYIRVKSLKHWLEKAEPKKSNRDEDELAEVARFFTNSCVTNLQEFLNNAETKVTNRLEIVKTLNKMQFEIRALLRQTKVTLKVLTDKDIATSPALPIQLQRDLLQLEGIDGCGTIYGKLTLHVSKNPTTTVLDKISFLLDEYRYNHGFKLEEVARTEKQAGGFSTIEAGNKLKGRLTDEGKRKLKQNCQEKKIDDYVYGTLGCYLKVRNEHEDFEEMYAVTCAHCFIDCNPKIKICQGNEFDFGETYAHFMDEEMMDVAIIKMYSKIGRECDTRFKIETKDGVFFRKSYIYNGESVCKKLEGKVVFKRGASSDLTRAVIISDDYRTECMLLETNFKFSEDFNILLDDLAGSNGDPFSVDGDSGSIVCLDRPDDGNIVLLSILKGSVSDKTNGQVLFYNSFHLGKSVDLMAQHTGLQLELESTKHPSQDFAFQSMNEPMDVSAESGNDLNSREDENERESDMVNVPPGRDNANDSGIAMDISTDSVDINNDHAATGTPPVLSVDVDSKKTLAKTPSVDSGVSLTPPSDNGNEKKI